MFLLLLEIKALCIFLAARGERSLPKGQQGKHYGGVEAVRRHRNTVMYRVTRSRPGIGGDQLYGLKSFPVVGGLIYSPTRRRSVG